MSDAPDEEIKDLIKRKNKLAKDSNRLNDLGDVVFRLGYQYFQKGYCKEALEEFENALEIRKRLSSALDIASTHRFIGETLCKLGNNFERAKTELDFYHSLTLRLNNLVELQRSHTTLGNYFMTLIENNYKDKRVEHLNQAFSHYLKSYELLDDISEKKLTDSKDLALMKARACLNCAFVMDEKRDLIVCNEYLKTAIEICEVNNFYEDLIRCLYIKCDQAKRKNKMEETLKVADRIIEITRKTRDNFQQQSTDFLFVADLYLKVQNLEKAKLLLKKAYHLRNKCLISPEVTYKLKNVINVIRLQNEINKISNQNDPKAESNQNDNNPKLVKIYEKQGDSYCNLALYELGLKSYFKQLILSKKLSKPDSEICVIYASIAQTYQDLENYTDALKYFEIELKTYCSSEEAECNSLLNIAHLKEKLQLEFSSIKDVYNLAYEKAKKTSKISLQIKIIKALCDAEKSYGINTEETNRKLNSFYEIKRMQSNSGSKEESESDEGEDSDEERENDEDSESIVISSDSEDDETQTNLSDEDEKSSMQQKNKSKGTANKKYNVKRNLRGETQLHVACIKGNFKAAKKLVEEGHPVNERDNLNWLPIHEACNYGHVELVDLLIRYGAKVNDLIGPITPLHDAAQNGHLQVLKLLLKAGALPYVFSKDGYTPLDFLCKYKQENESSMTPEEMQLYKESYEFMLNSIKNKDKTYKIKNVVSTEDNIINEEESNTNDVDMQIELAHKSSKKSINSDLILPDTDDENEEELDNTVTKKSKKNAIKEYREALYGIGSKSASAITSSLSHGKKVIDKVIVSENEYDANQDWLINDVNVAEKKIVNKKFSGTKLGTSTGNKRKHRVEEDDDDRENYFEMKEQQNNVELTDSNDTNDDEADYQFCRVGTSNAAKKRIIDSCPSEDDLMTNYDLHNNDEGEKLPPIDQISNKTSGNKNNADSTKLKDKINNQIYFGYESAKKDSLSEIDLTIESPFKTNPSKTKNPASHQLKLTKMIHQQCSLVSSSKKANSNELSAKELNQNAIIETLSSSDNDLKRLNISNASNSSGVNSLNSISTSTTWKLKAVIENRNLLIPVSNINATIDDLIKQILTRYKAMFSNNDPTFREPEKVLLKSSDDLILFGEDLIKDVLNVNDLKCEVHVLIESLKGAPTLAGLYEQACAAKESLPFFENIRKALKASEQTFCVNLAEMSLHDGNMASKQFEVLTEVIRLNSKTSPDYLKSLLSVDLSSNFLSDQVAISVLESFLSECASLKKLDLSYNLMTIKSLKMLNDAMISTKSLNSIPLEILRLNGNEIGLCQQSTVGCRSTLNSEIANTLNCLIAKLSNLKELYLSDCKLNLCHMDGDDYSSNSSNEIAENAWSRFFSTLKSSKINTLDVSFNKINKKYLTKIIENLPEHKLEKLNLSNCYFNQEEAINNDENMITSLRHSLSYSIRAISIRNLNMELSQTSELIYHLAGNCKQLKSLDLSYNSFDAESIKYLYSECVKLEETMLINNNSETSQMVWSEILAVKFEGSNTQALKHLELKLSSLSSDKLEIKSLFRKKWHKNLKIVYYSLNIMEFIVD